MMRKKKKKYELMFGDIPEKYRYVKPSMIDRLKEKVLAVINRRANVKRANKMFLSTDVSDFQCGIVCGAHSKEEMMYLEENGFYDYPAIARERGWDYFVSINRKVLEQENGPPNDRVYEFGDVRVLKEFMAVEDGHDDDPYSKF